MSFTIGDLVGAIWSALPRKDEPDFIYAVVAEVGCDRVLDEIGEDECKRYFDLISNDEAE